MDSNTVLPKAFSGFNVSLAQLFGSGPKFTITCGNCSLTFKKRIPMVDYPGIPCPSCGTINILSVEVC